MEMISATARYGHHNFMNIASQTPTPVPRATDPLRIVIPPPQVPIPMHKRRKGWRNTIVAGAFSLSPLFFFFSLFHTIMTVLILDLYFSRSQDQLWMNKGVQNRATAQDAARSRPFPQAGLKTRFDPAIRCVRLCHGSRLV